MAVPLSSTASQGSVSPPGGTSSTSPGTSSVEKISSVSARAAPPHASGRGRGQRPPRSPRKREHLDGEPLPRASPGVGCTPLATICVTEPGHCLPAAGAWLPRAQHPSAGWQQLSRVSVPPSGQRSLALLTPPGEDSGPPTRQRCSVRPPRPKSAQGSSQPSDPLWSRPRPGGAGPRPTPGSKTRLALTYRTAPCTPSPG